MTGGGEVTVTLTPGVLLAGVGVLVVAVLVWWAARRRARAAADAVRTGSRVVSLAGRVLLTGCLLTGAQWVLIVHGGNPWALLVALATPNLLAGFVLTRALTVTTVEARALRAANRRSGGRGRGGAR